MESHKRHNCKNIKSRDPSFFYQEGQNNARDILLIGESLSPRGWYNNQACYSAENSILPSGKRLNELLKPFHLDVQSCSFTELAKCCIKERRSLAQCSKKCWPHLKKQLEYYKPKLIILLGAGTSALFSILINQTIEVGEIYTVTLDTYSFTVISIYHPSPRNPKGFDKNKVILKKHKKYFQAFS